MKTTKAISLTIRTIFFLTFATFLGLYTYDITDTTITTTYLLATALTLYFPPIYKFIIPEQPTITLKKIDSKSIPTIISIFIFLLTYITLKYL